MEVGSTMHTNDEKNAVLLTKYAHGAGCGCKIAPDVLEGILKASQREGKGAELNASFPPLLPGLLVGHETKDDAAVFDLGDRTGVVSTTDFFMPIVDDAFTFGRIAATNALSDIYAMGGEPLMAIAILGWPINTLAPELAGEVVAGGRAACRAAGIVLAGGHSIDSPEPIFGLAVTGRVSLQHLKRNSTARENALLYLTKPLGVGLLTTMVKAGKLPADALDTAIASMTELNSAGAAIGKLEYVSAMTDVTGFGLLGHLLELSEGAGLGAEVRYSAVPKLEGIVPFLDMSNAPGGTKRNLKAYGEQVQLENQEWATLLADPQTSGGLLIACDPEMQAEFEAYCAQLPKPLHLTPLGKMVAGSGVRVVA
jgi:selenide, water dikinase